MKSLRPIFHLGKSSRIILAALIGALIVEPSDLVVPDKEGETLKKIETLLREFPRLMRFGFLCLLVVFDRLPVFFSFGFTRFIHLNLEQQQSYAERWHNTSNTVLREIFKSLRGIVMVAYFSQHAVWNYIGYNPKKYAADRIALRHKVMQQDQESALS